jgi:hypothetical protein
MPPGNPAAACVADSVTPLVATSPPAGISSVANFIKSYQQRTGKPHEAKMVDRH